MDRNAEIFLIDDFELSEHCNSDDIKIIESSIDIYDMPLNLFIGIIDGPVKLLDIVPLALAISDKICSNVINYLKMNKCSIPCEKGCCACCDYLVTLSTPEVFYLQEEFSKMPVSHSNRLLHSCLNSAEKILDLSLLNKHNMHQTVEISQISDWYSELGLSCPFLSKGTCSIYEKRPLACREHIVITHPESCSKNDINGPEIVPMPVSILEILGQLSAHLEQTTMEAVMLPLALVWKDNHTVQRSQRTWSASLLIEQFVKILEKRSKKNVAALTAES